MASDEAPAAKRSKITRDGRLDGKVVFITAAAQGIGRASALVSDFILFKSRGNILSSQRMYHLTI